MWPAPSHTHLNDMSVYMARIHELNQWFGRTGDILSNKRRGSALSSQITVLPFGITSDAGNPCTACHWTSGRVECFWHSWLVE